MEYHKLCENVFEDIVYQVIFFVLSPFLNISNFWLSCTFSPDPSKFELTVVLILLYR